jgi:hypothetical protein
MTSRQVFTSPQGDLLIVGAPPGTARFVGHEHAADYAISPDRVPSYEIINRVHLATISVAAEMGLSFERVQSLPVDGFDQEIRPVIRLEMTNKLRTLLLPFYLPIALCRPLFLSDMKLTLVVTHWYVLPRNKAFADIALRLATAPSAASNRRGKNAQKKDAS